MALARWRGEGEAVEVWDKAGTPVSDVDLAVDARLKAVLGAIAPDAGWLSEETADDPARLSRRTIWCVDPIDGTRDFVRGRRGWAVSVALVVDQQPRFGILYAPARDELWVAERGRGATRNGADLSASRRRSFGGARVPADSLPRVDSDLVMVDKPNSIALRMAMVAADEADLVATLRWGFEWDVAAAALIASEAGASVSDAFGAPLAFNTPRAQAFGVIACAPGIHAATVNRLATRAADIAPRTLAR
jgi:myo-inositol-1(or 4)-monophosphatase